MKKSLLTMVSTLALGFGMGSAHAGSITDVGDLPGGMVFTYIYGISADGTVVVGQGNGLNGVEAFRWTQSGGIVGIGDLPGGATASRSARVSADGTVIAGNGVSAFGQEGFRWTQGGGLVGIGDLAGGIFSSEVYGIDASGNVIVGESQSASGRQAFRWTLGGGMVGLGDLAGGTFDSSARGISADGNVVVGRSVIAGGTEAFRWTQGTGMLGIGDLAGGTFYSQGNAASADGSVIVGVSASANGTEAFRWTQGGGMVGLGDLAGGVFYSEAQAVSNDGSIVTGYSFSGTGQSAFRWTQATGMQSLQTILTTAGVDLTGWDLSSAVGMDSTGNLIVGNGTLNGAYVGFLANIQTMAVTTPTDLVAGLSSAIIPVQQTQSAMDVNIGQSLFAAVQSLSAFAPSLDMTNPSTIAPSAGDGDRLWSGYLVGSVGVGQDNDFENHGLNGTTGVLIELNKNLIIGGGIIGSYARADRSFDGDSTLDSKGGALIAAYESDYGLHLYGTIFAADLQIDSKRGYLNGAGLDASYADIDGIGYGAAVRAGWEFDVTSATSLMPYAEFRASRTKLDGYTETGGGFPATFDDTKNDQLTSYLGTQINHNLTPAFSIGGRAAWAHRLKENSDGVSANVVGFTGTLDSDGGDKNWAEGAVTTNWHITEATRLGAELSGRSGKTSDPAVTLTFGLQHKF